MAGIRHADRATGSRIATKLETHRRAKYPGSKAVLVAIAIPVFTAQLEKSREATDAANIRSAYAEVMAEALTQTTPAAVTRTITLKQQQADWQTSPAPNLAGAGVISRTGHVDATVTGTPAANGSCTVTWTPPTGTATEGTVAIAFGAATP